MTIFVSVWLLKGNINSQYSQRAWFLVLFKLKVWALPFHYHILLIHHLEKVPIPDAEQRADIIFYWGVQKELVSFVHETGWNQVLISQTFA